MNTECIPGDSPLFRSINKTRETICGGFRSNPCSWKITPEHVSDETSFTHRVLPHEHDLWLGIKFHIGEEGRFVEEIVAIAFLGGEDVVFVDGLELGIDDVGFVGYIFD